jgi:hypothetical protein
MSSPQEILRDIVILSGGEEAGDAHVQGFWRAAE